MELYIHIPFCIRKCAYCDFLSGPADKEVQGRYMQALLWEVSLAGKMHRERMRKHGEEHNIEEVDTVFIGGGTPSVVDAVWILRLMEQVRTSFCLAEDAEITMEANPGTLTAEKLAQYRQAGINRLSLGLQSTDDGELRRLGRIHTYGEFLENYRLAREAGFTNINIDLMSALPGQTVESYERTLRRVIALGPEHISAYSLIIEEGTPFWQRYGDDAEEREDETAEADDGENDDAENDDAEHDGGERKPTEKMDVWQLPTEDQDRQMYHLTKSVLAEAGYDRYEISNYARPGYACHHNVGYWTRVPYLGLGLGAASYYGGQRFTNTREREEYLSLLEQEDEKRREALPGDGKSLSTAQPHGETQRLVALRREVETLTRQDAMEEFMFLGLRLTSGVSASAFETIFGRPMEEVYGPVLQKMQRQGLMERAGQRWHLTDLGLDVSNYVLAEFLL